MTRAHVDVLVIGAGASGGVVAKRLAEAGLEVLCLEQGDWPDRADYPGATPEWEIVSGGRWSPLPHVRNGVADYPIDLSSSDMGVVNFNGVGGGTVLYNAQWPRMLPDDFRVHTIDGVAADWPIGYRDLQPYYEATDRDFGVSGLGGNPRYPAGEDPPLPPLPIGRAGLRVARAHAHLGWHWWPGTNAIASAPYTGRNPCVRRGTCGSGCNEGAKASTDLTHFPHVLTAGGRVVTGATVRRIIVDERGLACGAEWVDRDGAEHYQSADVVVCAANAIGTARLLLASASPAHPNGLANSSGLVGRNLMLHPLASVIGVFDEDFEGWRAQNGVLIHSLEFATSDASRGFVRGATWALTSSSAPLRELFAPDGRGRWGAEHHAHLRERLGRTATWVIIAEDLPYPENRVELSSTLVDATGLAAPRIVYRLDENTERLIRWNIERATESLQTAGAHRVDVIRHRANGHFMGTARMGIDPATSVVDPSCRAHDVPNLLIADGSVFVTAGSANPTSTIVALALRATDQLLAARDDVPRPHHRRSIGGFAPSARPAAPADVGAPTRSLRPDERSQLRSLAMRLIPAADGMPSAAEVDVASRLADRVLRARPDLVQPLCDALATTATIDVSDEELATDRRFAPIRYVVAAAYYLDPGVRGALGYDPERVAPVQALEYPAYLEEGLLDHLLAHS